MIYLDILNWDLELYLPSRQAGLTLDIRHLDFFRYWVIEVYFAIIFACNSIRFHGKLQRSNLNL